MIYYYWCCLLYYHDYHPCQAATIIMVIIFIFSFHGHCSWCCAMSMHICSHKFMHIHFDVCEFWHRLRRGKAPCKYWRQPSMMPKYLKRGTLLYIWCISGAMNCRIHALLTSDSGFVLIKKLVCRHIEQLAMDKLLERACKKLSVLSLTFDLELLG